MSLLEEKIDMLINNIIAPWGLRSITKYRKSLIEALKALDTPKHKHGSCHVCNKKLEDGLDLRYRFYCSKECREKAEKIKRKAYTLMKKHSCYVCGDFVPDGRNMYCSDKCKHEYISNPKNNSALSKAQKRERDLHIKCKECGK